MKQSRDNWIDHIKIFACILVAIGHVFQSMCSSAILETGALYEWFDRTIYYFHVPLFFICSGYVYQKYSQVNSFATWKRNALKKLLGLGVPYIVFSLITWTMKKLFSGEVNSEVHSLGYDLFIHPLSPYWYLFSLFFIFLITRTFASKKTCCIGLAVAALMKILSIGLPYYALKIVLSNQIWFVMGMAACVFDFSASVEKLKWWAWIAAGLFLLLSFTQWRSISFLMGLLACGAIMVMFIRLDGKSCVLAEYTMPVFLMHTIFAAGVRVVLLKLGIAAPVIHIVLGLGASFTGPIVAAEGMKKLKLDIMYQPGKYIKLKK